MRRESGERARPVALATNLHSKQGSCSLTERCLCFASRRHKGRQLPPRQENEHGPANECREVSVRQECAEGMWHEGLNGIPLRVVAREPSSCADL